MTLLIVSLYNWCGTACYDHKQGGRGIFCCNCILEVALLSKTLNSIPNMALLVDEDSEAEGEALHPSGGEPELVWNRI